MANFVFVVSIPTSFIVENTTSTYENIMHTGTRDAVITNNVSR